MSCVSERLFRFFFLSLLVPCIFTDFGAICAHKWLFFSCSLHLSIVHFTDLAAWGYFWDSMGAATARLLGGLGAGYRRGIILD